MLLGEATNVEVGLPPPLTAKTVAYAWRQLAIRAGVKASSSGHTGFEGIGVRVCYAKPDDAQATRNEIIVVPCANTAWHAVLERPPRNLDWLQVDEALPPTAQSTLDGLIPVLFWGEGYEHGTQPFAERREDGSVVFYADIVAATVFMLCRWEEMVLPDRDGHGRFCATASVAHRQGFLDRPIIDEYAIILKKWLQSLRPSWQPAPQSFRVIFSHDMDRPLRGLSWKGAVRIAIEDLVVRRAPMQALATLSYFCDVRRDITRDEFYSAFRTLMDRSEQLSLTSTFNFMASLGGPFDRGYDPRQRPYRDMIEEVITRGHRVGFHAGYSTLGNLQRLREEKDRLAEVLGHTVCGGRQHYLRFQVPRTWQHWEQAGMAYDSTMAYADHEGFRCGTCYPFRPFDLERNCELDLREWPLILMDGTLRDYRGLTPAQAEARILELSHRCRRVSGTLILLWHNTSLIGKWRPWVKVYRRVTEALG